jgi:cell division protein FtsB
MAKDKTTEALIETYDMGYIAGLKDSVDILKQYADSEEMDACAKMITERAERLEARYAEEAAREEMEKCRAMGRFCDGRKK